MAYVYRHIRLDKNEPFYIGIGSDNEGFYKRAYSKKNRNSHWKNIIKYGYEVEIILDDLTWEKACTKEIEFIKLYGRKDLGKGTLVNMTDGGDGLINASADTIKKISNSLLNHKPWNKGKVGVYSSEVIERIRKSSKKSAIGKNKGEKNGMYGKSYSKKRIQTLDNLIIFESGVEASKYYNVTPATISHWIKKHQKIKFYESSSNINNG